MQSQVVSARSTRRNFPSASHSNPSQARARLLICLAAHAATQQIKIESMSSSTMPASHISNLKNIFKPSERDPLLLTYEQTAVGLVLLSKEQGASGVGVSLRDLAILDEPCNAGFTKAMTTSVSKACYRLQALGYAEQIGNMFAPTQAGIDLVSNRNVHARNYVRFGETKSIEQRLLDVGAIV